MGDVAGPLSTDKLQSNHVYQSETFDVYGHDVHLRIGVFGDTASGFDVNYRYYEGGNAGELSSTHVESAETAGRLFWEKLNSLPSGTGVNELYITPDKTETKQGERNVTTKPAEEKSTADNIAEGAKGEPIEKPEQVNTDRPTKENPQSEETKEEYSGGTFLEDVEHWIPSLFQPAQQGIANWKNDLTEYTQDGGSPILCALAATGLDVLDTAMSFTQGIPLGFLDIRNIGEGLAEGTWEGFKRDASRALNVIPQGKILRAVDRAITVSNVVENTASGDYNAAALEAGITVLAHRKGAKGRSDPKSKSTRLSKKIGAKPEDIIYSASIASDKLLKTIKKGEGTGMDSNHLLLSEWFRKGPEHIKGLQDYVPSTLLAGGMEHQGTFHGAFNELMRKEGLFQKSKYSQAEIEKAMLIAEKFFKNNPGGELGKSWAAACKYFRLNIFNQVKK